jgi:hypothetical protein
MQVYSTLLENYLTHYGGASPCVVLPVPTTLVYTPVMALMVTTDIPHFVLTFYIYHLLQALPMRSPQLFFLSSMQQMTNTNCPPHTCLLYTSPSPRD